MNSNRSDQGNPDRLLSDDALVVAIWTILGVFGIVTNLLTIAGVCRNRTLRRSTSYWLITSLALCDTGMLIVCLAHLIPASILHERYVYMVDFSNAFGVFVYDAFWYTGVLHLMLMSINRYISICWPKYYQTLFSRRITVFIVVSLYLIGISWASPGLFPCCYVIFNSHFYAAQYEPIDTPYRFVDMAINGSSVVVMAFCYVSILVRVRRSRVMLLQYRQFCREQRKTALAYAKSASTTGGRRNSVTAKLVRLLRAHATIASRREVKLFFQFATVSVIFFVTFFTWSWLPHLESHSKWIGFVMTTLFFINNLINPIVYFVFNSAVRRQIHKMLCPFTIATANSPMAGQFRRDQRDHKEKTIPNSTPQSGSDMRRSKSRIFVLRRLKSSPSVRQQQRKRLDQHGQARIQRRRSTAFDLDDEIRLLRTSTNNEAGDNETENNATCSLMAMAAFLNTTTITGGVLLKAIQQDEEKRKHLIRRLSRIDDDADQNKQITLFCPVDTEQILIDEPSVHL